jgi:hypothetical protein
MLPPHRPFREKPATTAGRIKKVLPSRPPRPGTISVRGVRRDLKPDLLVVDRGPVVARSTRPASEAHS